MLNIHPMRLLVKTPDRAQNKMIEIRYNDETLPKLDEKILEQAALATLKQQDADDDIALTILLTDDVHIQELNRDYRGYDKPTDVLSFEAHERDLETGLMYLGDIVISLARAAAQAKQGGHPLLAETQLLVVHGVLHLLGHDHAEAEEKAVMWNDQAEILGRLGLSDIKILEE